jgi:hypothetical protein
MVAKEMPSIRLDDEIVAEVYASVLSDFCINNVMIVQNLVVL